MPTGGIGTAQRRGPTVQGSKYDCSWYHEDPRETIRIAATHDMQLFQVGPYRWATSHPLTDICHGHQGDAKADAEVSLTIMVIEVSETVELELVQFSV